MIWHQVYVVFGLGPGLSFLLAALPILTMLLLLGYFRRPAWFAGLCGLCVTLVLAVAGYRMPVVPALSAIANGAAFGLFPISWIVFWAITLFRVSVETGQFEIIKGSLGRLTPDSRLQALLIAFAFGGFLEGAAGFGTPVAIASTMLVGLGFSAFSACAICLLANTAPVAFGSIGIPIITLAGTTGLPLNRLSAAVGAICTPLAILLPFYLLFSVGGLEALAGVILPTAIAGCVFGGVQYLVSTYLGPALTDILAAIASILTLVVYLRATRAADVSHPRPEHAAMLRSFAHLGGATPEPLAMEERVLPAYPVRLVLRAWMPYGLLVCAVILWGWAPLQKVLNRATVLIHWPLLDGVIYRMPPIVTHSSVYPATFNLNLLAAAGTACMVATLLSAAALGMHPKAFGRVLLAVVRQLRLPTLTVMSVLGIAFLMNFCGATGTLGLGFAATGVAFPFFSILLGWLGVFLTGSDTSANALFGNLQVVTAARLGLSPVLMAAANSSGGVMGKMISLQTIAIAAGATGLTVHDQVRLFRFTLRHSLILAGLAGIITLLYAYVFHLG